MNEQNVIYLHHRTLFSYKIKRSTDTYHSVDKPEITVLSKRSHSQKASHIILLHIYKMSKRGKSTETESSSYQGLEWGRWGVTVNRYVVSFRDDENVLKLVAIVAQNHLYYK